MHPHTSSYISLTMTSTSTAFQYYRYLTSSAGDPKFVIQPVPVKGLGVVATRTIAKGEEILSEAPFFTQGRSISQQTIASSLASKTSDEKRQYLGLANCHQGKMGPLVGIFHTNALPCGNNGGLHGATAAKSGLFFQGCKFNSSCIPNVNNCWDEGKGVIRFHALKDITEGEELCISYGDILTSRAMRRLWQAGFGFECRCPACSLSNHEQLVSDNRRRTAKSMFDEIGGCGSRPAEGVKKVGTISPHKIWARVSSDIMW